MIFSLLHFVLTVRALLRCASEKYLVGVVGSLVRALLLVLGAVLVSKRSMIVMIPPLPTLTVNRAATESEPSLVLPLLAIVGPLLTFALLWVAYRRFQDVPAAQEEKLQRPFDALLPVGIVDAIGLVIFVGAVAFAAT